LIPRRAVATQFCILFLSAGLLAQSAPATAPAATPATTLPAPTVTPSASPAAATPVEVPPPRTTAPASSTTAPATAPAEVAPAQTAPAQTSAPASSATPVVAWPQQAAPATTPAEVAPAQPAPAQTSAPASSATPVVAWPQQTAPATTPAEVAPAQPAPAQTSAPASSATPVVAWPQQAAPATTPGEVAPAQPVPASSSTTPSPEPAQAAPQSTAPAAPAPQQAAQTPAASNFPIPQGLSDFSGYVAETTAHFTFVGAADGAFKGSYSLPSSDQKPVTFEGRAIDATSFSAKTTDPDHPYLYLKLDKSGDKPRLLGAIYANGGGAAQSVVLTLEFADSAMTEEAQRFAAPVETAAPTAADVRKNAQAFLDAVKAADAEKAASLVAFPIAYTARGRRTLIHDPAEFQKKFHAIFTSLFLSRLARVQADALHSTPQGLELGPGEVWFNEEGKAFALNNEPIKMFQAKRFLTNAGWTRAGTSAAPVAAKSTGSNANADAATPGQRPKKRRRRRRHSPPGGDTSD
jgi:hypothetical protein